MICALHAVAAHGQAVTLHLTPAHTTVNWTLGDVLHTVKGTFQLKRGDLQLDPSTGKVTGDVVVDGRSGESGNSMRDRKMHREVLESDKFPDIGFRPDQVNGAVNMQGKSSVQVHGIFSIHGADHELSVPADVELAADHWTATLHFSVPYEKWGMKNPSTLFLRVSDAVQIDLIASGSLTRP